MLLRKPCVAETALFANHYELDACKARPVISGQSVPALRYVYVQELHGRLQGN